MGRTTCPLEPRAKGRIMKNRLLTVVAGILLIFPFTMVAYELAMKESMVTVGLFATILAVLFGTILLAFAVSRPKKS